MTAIAVSLSLGAFAQEVKFAGEIANTSQNKKGEKLLKMDEAVLGYNIMPANKSFAWRPETDQYTYTDGNTLCAKTPKGKSELKLINTDELTEIIGDSISRFPAYAWRGENEIQFNFGGKLYKVDIKNKKLVFKLKLPAGGANFKISSSDLIAYTKKNNLFIFNPYGEIITVTDNKNEDIISGDVASRNEFGISEGIFWSNNSKLLAFYQKDVSKVTSYPLVDITSRTGGVNYIKYPMAGMDSELVELGVYNTQTAKTIFLKVNEFTPERYLSNITWSPCDKYIYIQVVARNQKEVKLNKYSAETGEFISTILEEKNDKYAEPNSKLVFLKSDKTKFIYNTNCRDGYKNLYLCSDNGKIERFTKVDADVDYVGQDAKNIYYYSYEVSPIEKHLFKQNIKTGKRERLTAETGVHSVSLSSDGKYFIDTYSNLSTPRDISLKSTSSDTKVSLLSAKNPASNYKFGDIHLGTIKSADGKYDNYYRLTTPPDFDPTKKYPVIIYVYGGPHSQMVSNSWGAGMRFWEMLMAQKGYIVYVQDNRGTAYQGLAFEQAIYGRCGVHEMEDQMEGVKMLQSLPYVDTSRMGVHGWSYGGFMTISLMTTYPDVFKVGVAGGPVVDWKWYEIMYGERYMSNPKDNKAGYDEVSLIGKAANLNGKLLICQGVIDNVVVWQHSLNFVQACIKAKKQVDYFPYPRSEHNVLGVDRIHLMDKVTNYFDDYL